MTKKLRKKIALWIYPEHLDELEIIQRKAIQEIDLLQRKLENAEGVRDFWKHLVEKDPNYVVLDGTKQFSDEEFDEIMTSKKKMVFSTF